MSRKWSVMERSLHINLLELSVVENAIQRQRQIQTYLKTIQQWSPTSIAREETICSHVGNDMDDSTLMSLLGCNSFEKHTFLGKNVIANQLSIGRQIQKMTELSLNQDEIQRLFRVYSTLNIDLLATKENENYQSFVLHSKII